MMTTVRQIAEFAGVSKSTVSLVLNNKAGVSDEMRQTVLKAVEELQAISPQYSPNEWEHVNGDAKARALSVMVLHPPILRSSYVFSEVLQGIQSASEMFNVQLRLVMNEPNASPQHIAHLYLSDENLRPDGVLVFGTKQDEPLLDKAMLLGIPCVVLGRDLTHTDISGIRRHEVSHAFNLVAYLTGLGHERIAFVGGNTAYDYTHTRLEGYRQALLEAKIKPDTGWVCLGNGVDATEKALSISPAVTAMVFVNDTYLAEGLSVLRAREIAVPQQVSVASFDNTDVARQNVPSITSISYDRVREGHWALKILVDQVRYPFLERAQLTFKAQLVVRASTAVPQTMLSSAL